MDATTKEYQVLVVGAGLTGLVAARQCQKLGRNVLVLEGRDRVGGRTETVTFDRQDPPSHFDLGGRFVAMYQHDVYALIKELELDTFNQYQGPGEPRLDSVPIWDGLGANLLQLDGQRGHMAYIGPVLPTEAADQFYLKLLKTMIEEFPVHDPTKAENASALDQFSVHEWVSRLALSDDPAPSDAFRGLLRLLCRVGFSEEPENISVLWLLFYVASSGGLDRFQSVRWPKEGAQALRITTGAASISSKLAEQFEKEGGELIKEQTVWRIESVGGRVRVTTRAGAEYVADKVLVALSPTLYVHDIEFSPELPPGRVAAAKAMQNASMIVATVTFTKPFWRSPRQLSGMIYGNEVEDIARLGLSGDVLSTHGPVVWMMDGSSHAGQPAVFAFIVGHHARALRARTRDERKEVVLTEMRRAFGDEVDAHGPQYYEQDWSGQKLSGGGPAAHFPSGKFFQYGREILITGNGRPHGNIYFASSETALLSNGYMSGAVWSGLRIADEICGVSAREKLKTTGRVREMAMLWCMRTILRAVERQEPALELPALSKRVLFFGPGGTTLPRGPYEGHKGTFIFYQQLARCVTISKVNIEACSADVETNSGFAVFSVNGMVNESRNPFRDIKATMVFDFNNDADENERVVVTRDWLFMDTAYVDALVAAPPGPFSEVEGTEEQKQELLALAARIAELDPSAVEAMKVPVRVLDINAPPARRGIVKATAPVIYRNAVEEVTNRFQNRKVVASHFDRRAMTYYSWQSVGKNDFILVSVRFAGPLDGSVAEVEIRH